MSNYNCPLSATTIFFLVAPDCDPNPSIALTTSIPSTTLPKTTCFPSNHGHGTVVKKNCDPLVPGPALAIDNKPGWVCLRVKFLCTLAQKTLYYDGA